MRMLAGLALLLSTVLLGAAPGQDGLGGILYTRNRQFRVPFNLGPGGQTLQQLQLYVSTDFGQTWQAVASAPPDQGFFRFSTDRDGQYWFAVQTTDKNNRTFPVSMEGATPNLKVLVDNTPPLVSLTRLNPRGNEVGVSWQVRDDAFSAAALDAVRLEYRLLNGGPNWTPLIVPPGATQLYWNPNTAAPVEVRLQARDQAGNVGEAFASVSLAGGSGADPLTGGGVAGTPGWTGNNPNPAVDPRTRFTIDPAASGASGGSADRFAGVANPPTMGELKLVNSKRISLNYDLKDVGPSSVSGIELWYTHDGKNWNRYSQPFQDDPTKKLVFEMEREGLYGITLLAKSGVGLGERPPQAGDRPQLWIEVDLTRPVVNLRNTLVGQGLDKGKLKITWTASDRNLAPHGSISLKYAEQGSGPWTPIAEKIDNRGEYTWTMPAQGLPFQFYVKAEAVDRAGNLGEDATPQPVKVDLSIPRAIPRDISPVAN